MRRDGATVLECDAVLLVVAGLTVVLERGDNKVALVILGVLFAAVGVACLDGLGGKPGFLQGRQAHLLRCIVTIVHKTVGLDALGKALDIFPDFVNVSPKIRR